MKKVLGMILFSSLLMLQSCFLYGKKNSLTLSTTLKQKDELDSAVTSVNVSNNLVTIQGSGFSNVTVVKLTGTSLNADLNIDSKSDSQIIASATSAFSLLVGETFNLIIGTASATVTYTITFTLDNGSVTAAKLASMGATAGQVLKYNGTSWAPASMVETQVFKGTWDAGTTIPDVTVSSPGDYYIVSVAGGTYSVGDWIVSDGYSWTKVPYSSTSVSSFQGRKGIVTLTPADYVSMRDGVTSKVTGSKIADIADVDLTGIADGKLLKWDATNSKWIVGSDATGTSGIALTDLSASAPLSYNSTTGAFSISAATTSAAGSLSSADKTKIDSIPGSGDGLFERFSGTIAMKSCSGGEMLVWLAPTGWSCTTGAVALTMGMSRNTTANTAGSDLTLQASGATTSATDKNGGSLVLSSGIATGTGSSAIEFKTATASSTGVSDNTPSTKMTILGNGNVGIGTTSPTTKLHLFDTTTNPALEFSGTTVPNFTGVSFAPAVTTQTTGRMTQASLANGGLAFLGFSANTNVVPALAFTGYLGPTSPTQPAIAFDSYKHNGTTGRVAVAASELTAQWRNAGSPLMTLLGSGNVGIGTTSPTASLSITPGSTSSGAITMSATSGSTTFTTSASTTLNVGDYLIPTTTTGQARAVSVGGTGTSFTSSTAFSANVTAETYTVYPAAMNVNSGKLFVQGSTGNVGIGTATAEFPFTLVNGTNGTEVTPIEIRNPNTANNTGTGIKFTLSSGSGVANAGGRIGGIRLGVNGEGGLTFQTTSTSGSIAERVRMDNLGNVGIGTTSPTARLMVTPGSASSGAITMSATSGSATFTTSASTTLNVGDYLIPTTTTGQARAVSVGGTGTSFTSSNSFTANVSGETYTVYPAAMNVNSGKLFVQGSTGNVGIGTSSPSRKLDVVGNIYASSTITGLEANFGTVYIGGSELKTYYNNPVRISNEGVAAGSDAVYLQASYNTPQLRIGTYGVKIDNSLSVGSTTAVTGGIAWFNGNVGIGTSSPSTRLHVLGSSGATIATFADGGATTCTVTPATTGFACSSDLKLKKNIESVPDMDLLDKVLKLRTVTYNWRNIDNGRHTGYIAQEVEKIAPEFVRTGDDGYKQVSYAGFIPWITGAIKGLYKKVESLFYKVMNLEDKMATNEREIASVKAEVIAKLEAKAKKFEAETLILKKENEQMKAKLEKIEKLLEKNK